MPTVIRVVTKDSLEDMLAAGGSAAWFGNRLSFERADYLLAVRNGGEREPILLAKIDNVVPVPESGERRYSLQFHEYVRPKGIPYKRDVSSNPAIGKQASEILPGLDFSTLRWETAGPPTQKWSFSKRVGDGAIKQDKPEAKGITIAEAKKRLSIGLGVPEERIEITIRA